jgi:hypothetical protein
MLFLMLKPLGINTAIFLHNTKSNSKSAPNLFAPKNAGIGLAKSSIRAQEGLLSPRALSAKPVHSKGLEKYQQSAWKRMVKYFALA